MAGAVIKFKQKGDFKRTENWLNKIKTKALMWELDKWGQMGVDALAAATPVDTGKTASSWTYKYYINDYGVDLVWSNTNKNKGIPIAVLIQYGHGTRNGGYVQGRDYINPAIQPIFDEIADSLWKKVLMS